MTDAQKVTTGKVVLIHYTLTNAAGEELDSSGNKPLPYLHGFGNIVPGLEQALEGMSVGQEFEVSVAPKDGYGEVDPKGRRQLPRSAFPKDVELEAGMQFATETPSGDIQPLWIVKASALSVEIDTNHPLAGETLHFKGSVAGMREALPAEIEHGHVHGPDGHHHH